jgi:uncharacterized protein (DUF2126 family)/transglutaminase-like putative cysteine protease
MAIHVALHHRTTYTYDRLVTLGPQIVRLRPAPHCRTPILSYSLTVEPAGHFINWQQDPQSNYLARLVFPEKVRSLTVEVSLVAEMAVYNPFDFFLEPGADQFPFAYEARLAVELAPYLRKDVLTPRFEALLKSIDLTPKATINFLVELNQRLWKDLKYLIRLEPGIQSPEETLEKASGSCRDSAWLLVQLFRHLGLAARFVSGYLIQMRPDQKSLDGPSGAEQDFTDLHAWCEVFLPGAGWIGLDPTSGLLAGEGHLPLACSPEPSSAAPISGGVDECETKFDVTMKVSRLYESPRVTLPYSDEQWADIEKLGQKIDDALRARDVRLTMGGEPTFISIDDMDGAEWNTAAVGPNKRRLAEQLIKRLWDHYGKGGFLHYGQGKWYPGESLPRWAFSAIWRRDGQPIWQNPALLADLGKPGTRTINDARLFASELAQRLGVGERWLMPGYEDAFYYLWKERRLPSNVDPLHSNLSDGEERARLAKLFERGLNQITGFALPLERGHVDGRPGWVSGPWFLRPERLFLLPGDSPMGLRLPLDSQPWIAPTDVRYLASPDPQLELPPLPDRPALARQYFQPGSPAQPRAVDDSRSPWNAEGDAAAQNLRPQSLPPPDRPPEPGVSASWIVRTALCVEPREGHIFVFMPPVATTEAYLELLAAVEATAAHLGIPAVIEGYLPPHDARLNSIKVTPDPGVIEVNVHPSASWPELVEKTEFLYGTARECRLGTEKFMLDGRHTGTGGGNHIIIGGERPSDSPLLRRPHLLKSLLAYWHNHPSLSYLFSGLFIGPTSQAPRVDEARNDSLYELEIAFRELDRQQRRGSVAPWLVDRIFRNLLTDVTGNTHRAEFCIDKLYSPDSATGRLGLLELRAFEMPPHARMSLAQQLLLRAFVRRFWDEPYEPARLVRWGTDLHDRFMLPHYCRQDFADVVADLRRWGMPFEEAWFAPHFEFKFPLNGRIQHRGLELELRHALEPWHVMGEEGAAGGTVRFVDSSVERVQVKVTGLTPERYYVACNGARVPLQPTGVNGEFVAGVRYRAWQPAACLHPTIGVDSPLVFDVVDTWNRVAVAGCTYHVAHPGGRNYTTFPVNAYEAESRRLARFFPYGHTPGQALPIEPVTVAPELPHTLDLRDPVKVQR